MPYVSRSNPATAGGPTVAALELRHPRTGHSVTARLGYAYPVLVLGPIPLFMARRWRLAAITTAATVLMPLVGQAIMAAFINKLQLKSLLAEGYKVVSNQPGMVSAAEWKLGMQLPRYSGRAET